MKSKLVILTLFLVFFLIGFVVGDKSFSEQSEDLLEMRETGYKYISPLLDCQIKDSSQQKQTVLLKNKLEEYITTQKEKQNATHVSVYFRDLANGPWMGIDEKELFTPASLLKIPIMMAVLKTAEKDPTILSQTIISRFIDDGVVQDVVPSKHLIEGQKYTIFELLERMIVYSDNQAKNLLLTNMTQESINRIYTDLGLDVPGVFTPDDFMTVKGYASFFRILYNASYLNKEMSNKALELLSKAEFAKGLTAGVPKDIVVAHKFGERTHGPEKQLHDCGIIYFPHRSYILCVMTRGDRWENLTSIIRTVSRIVYDEVEP
ncbi:hypothetical protein A2334_06045 [Candidatus Roizmanbacteria bacterium RIFOXYB2_FULL_38_10]|uniref:Beta-lactamase class A catalytic domain-containing protein n=1 Tax=Candidatus Roizmanbacteria bacterium RIFOXYD1_FULL_38_12 TaxID=1802093 RepID=A0A1F7L1Z8_9BACT|nr:MAG: hypothetical protein A3K47_05045 [Candidatus Roizmanbacteria bacterium RIFOXYA2_FULL_38_14]OGK64116.1 MAG: hypothetical protein A3K27_05045 [Candidatus Roizmanbacteria bacterium RIFOXYA1_FULL_37_12]OGK65962.1 MAG: hypothetical protein A3K38_05045 [Candidatus Roizmanbacteria bacterium RIFOXYB1_FULL_40_23]OGK68409.1 MAG: hypothetical protein A2334_06045 [Candidatus Roizmanbacteria bacterium RIFOXYB2_FULL_38_10]OGK70367.1 MAG: hypothetical protein A3K21_05050 [Candidatus Roizmanbacteria ba